MKDYSENNSSYFKKYILPILLGILGLTIYYLLIEEYKLNKRDFGGSIAVVVVLVIEMINRQKGPKIPIPWLDKAFKYYFGKRENDNIKTGFNINDYIDNDTFVVSYSKSKLGFNFIGSIVMAVLVGYLFLKDGLYVLSAGIIYIIGKGMYNKWNEVGDNSPKIIMKKEGIATPQIGFVKWEDVKLIQFRDTSSSETESTNLDIFLSEKEKWMHPEFTIMINDLNKNKKEMTRMITKLKGSKPNN